MKILDLKLLVLLFAFFTHTAVAGFLPVNGGRADQASIITSAAGTTTLVATSNQIQHVEGSTTQTIVLPNATLLPIYWFYEITNNSTGSVTVKDGSSATIGTIGTKQVGKFMMTARAAAAGTWKVSILAGLNDVGTIPANASTADALSANPTDCASGEFATTIAANGNLTCSVVGLATTATALASEPTDCSVPGSFATGIDTQGNLTCSVPTAGSGDVTGPASSTNGALARFDGTTGKLLEELTTPGTCGAGDFATGIDEFGEPVCDTPASGGITALGAFGSTPAAEGASISGTTLTLQPADATNGGGVSTTTQTFAGAKTFSSAPTFSTMTLGSVLFAGTSGIVSQDNSGFFYDATNHRLGVGTATPAYRFQVTASADNYSHGMAISHSLGDANALYRFYVDYSNNVLSICNPNQTTCSFATDHLGRVQLSGGAYAGGGAVNIANQTGRTADHTLELTKIGSQTGELLNIVSNDGTTVLSKINASGAGTFAGLTVSTLGAGWGIYNASGVASSNAPSDCSAGDYVKGLNTDGTLDCSTPSGGSTVPVLTAKTTTYTLTTSDGDILCNSATPFTITLYAANDAARKSHSIKNINTGACTIARASSDTIDGETSIVLNSQYEAVTLKPDGSAAWYIF